MSSEDVFATTVPERDAFVDSVILAIDPVPGWRETDKAVANMTDFLVAVNGRIQEIRQGTGKPAEQFELFDLELTLSKMGKR